MLVLSRKPGESILVGEEIKVTVVRVGPNSVRLGIDAPGYVNIRRSELEQQGELLDELARDTDRKYGKYARHAG